MRALSCLLLLCFALLGGCSSSLFESLPAGTVTTCDPALPGHWIVTHSESASDGAIPHPLEIAADCRTVIDAGQPKPVQVNFVHSRAGNFLEALNDSGKLDCAGENDTYCGHFLVRYALTDRQLSLYFPDHARISEALTKGQIEGYQTPQPQDLPQGQERIYHNFIAGNPEQIARILRRHPEFFASQPTTVLERAPPPAQTPAPPAAAAPDAAPDAAAAPPQPPAGDAPDPQPEVGKP